MPSFILNHPTVWPQYTNVTDRTGQDRTDNGLIAYSEPFYKQSPKNYNNNDNNNINKFYIPANELDNQLL